MLSKPSPSDIARQHGLEELEHLRRRVVLWRDDYLSYAPPAGGEEYLFLVSEFIQEIEDYIYIFVQRLRATDHIDDHQVKDFMDYCYQQVDYLRDYILRGDNAP